MDVDVDVRPEHLAERDAGGAVAGRPFERIESGRREDDLSTGVRALQQRDQGADGAAMAVGAQGGVDVVDEEHGGRATTGDEAVQGG